MVVAGILIQIFGLLSDCKPISERKKRHQEYLFDGYFASIQKLNFLYFTYWYVSESKLIFFEIIILVCILLTIGNKYFVSGVYGITKLDEKIKLFQQLKNITCVYVQVTRSSWQLLIMTVGSSLTGTSYCNTNINNIKSSRIRKL